MLYNIDYTNCKVVLRNEITGVSIGETKIMEYNKRQLSIFIDAREFIDQLNGTRLAILIFANDAIHIFGGVARKSYSPRRVEISMFQGKEHEDRAAKRYPANVPAVVSDIFYPEDDEHLDKKINVQVLNLSTNGVLIESSSDDLEKNTEFVLTLNISGSPTLIKCTVVRTIEPAEGTRQFGCKFLSITNN